MKALRSLLPFLVAAWFVGVLMQALRPDADEPPSPRVGRPAPPFSLPRLDDPSAAVRPADLRGRVWVLNVWASWCAVCDAEHGLLRAFAQSHRVPLVGLDYRDTRPQALARLRSAGNPYERVAFDATGGVGADYGVVGVPMTFVIDQTGVIRYRHVGALTWQLLRSRVEPLLQSLAGQPASEPRAPAKPGGR